ncbi:MAG TPA: TPM domain-containing protein [Rhodoblastus sp.]|nr:TPM domain-containing protein [Rhodoblastus sp.]
MIEDRAPIAEDDRARIAAAIHAAEQKTAGDIVCVLMRASSSYSYAPLLWASLIALLSPWALVAATQMSVVRILAAQVAIFVAVGLILMWTPLRMALVPRAVKRTRAHRAGMEQFFARGIAQTKNRMGVMIFVSLAEHYAHVVADDGIAARVDHAVWRETVDALTSEIAQGHIADGFIAAIERCGAVMAEIAPPDGTAHTLPDRIYVL